MNLKLRVQVMFWPILWLLGFRIWREDNIANIKIPRWIPDRQRQKIADAFMETLKWQKFDTRIL